MTRLSANLGFLFTDKTLPDAIRAAKAAGFDAVECHWPYDVPSQDIKAALDETGLQMLGLNTIRGNLDAGDNGLCALPGREDEAVAAITQAVTYAKAIGAGAVHVMSGFAEGDVAHATYVKHLRLACDLAAPHDIMILIEPLNRFDAPGYFLKTTAQAREIIQEIDLPNLRMMFDCYHVGRTEGDVVGRLKDVLPCVGHIQFASVPDRGTPDHGDVDFSTVFKEIETLGWTRPLGAEYKPTGPTEDSLAWMANIRTV